MFSNFDFTTRHGCTCAPELDFWNMAFRISGIVSSFFWVIYKYIYIIWLVQVTLPLQNGDRVYALKSEIVKYLNKYSRHLRWFWIKKKFGPNGLHKKSVVKVKKSSFTFRFYTIFVSFVIALAINMMRQINREVEITCITSCLRFTVAKSKSN